MKTMRLIIVFLLACVTSRLAAQTTPAPAFTGKGRGVNIIGYDAIWRSFDQARFKAGYFKMLHEGGFDLVRVNLHPFKQMGAGPEYKLTDAWYRVADWAVTNALANQLTVILDFHEFNTMGNKPEENKDKFIAFWRQVSERYSTASKKVVFEILNEPNTKLTPQLWNQYQNEALALIRKTNPDRPVIVGPAFWNSVDHLNELELPESDRNLIVTVHFYKPMEFTHQGAPWVKANHPLGTEWTATDAQKAAIDKDFDKVQAWAVKHNRPIFLGEFGAYDKAPMSSRACYTDYVARAAEKRNWSWAYWQFDSDFILYNIDKEEWVKPIHKALVP